MSNWEYKAIVIAQYIYAMKGVRVTILEPATPEQWDKLEHAFTVAIRWIMGRA